MLKHKYLVVALLVLVITTIYQFLPTLYFPYIANDSLWELWQTDLEWYYKWAVIQGRPLRHMLISIGTYIVDNSIFGLSLLRYINLLIYVFNSILLFFIVYKFIKPNLVFSLLFVIFFNSLQSSQIQLAWAVLAIQQILHTNIYGLAYIVLSYLHYGKAKASNIYCLVFLVTVVINLLYPISSLMLCSILAGYLLFNFDYRKHLKAFLILGLLMGLSFIFSKIMNDLLIVANGISPADSHFTGQSSLIHRLDMLSYARDTIFGSLIFGDTLKFKTKLTFNMIMVAMAVVVVIFYDKSPRRYLKYGLFILALLLCSTGNVLKLYYTLRTTYPVAMAMLFLLLYAVSLLCRVSYFKHLKKWLGLLFALLAFYFMIAANFSLMRGFIYPRLKEMDYYRYQLISKNVQKGDTIVVVRPFTSNGPVYGSTNGRIEFDFAYNTWNEGADGTIANFYMQSLGLNSEDYNYIYIKVERGRAMPAIYRDKLIIDLRLFNLTERRYARYIKDNGQRVLLR